MKRRGFLQFVASLPFVGLAAPAAKAAPAALTAERTKLVFVKFEATFHSVAFTSQGKVEEYWKGIAIIPGGVQSVLPQKWNLPIIGGWKRVSESYEWVGGCAIVAKIKDVAIDKGTE